VLYNPLYSKPVLFACLLFREFRDFVKITGCENKSVDKCQNEGFYSTWSAYSCTQAEQFYPHHESSTEIKPNGIVSHAGGDMTTEFSTVAKYGIFDHFTVIFFIRQLSALGQFPSDLLGLLVYSMSLR